MKLDVRSLRTFSRLAHTGAERAAGSLSTMTGIETYVDVTKVELCSREAVARRFQEQDLVSVKIGFDGGLEGTTVLAFPRDGAADLVETLMPGAGAEPGGDLAVSSLKEVGNIMIGGFIDGWADYLETTIDISTPTYVDVDGHEPLTAVDHGTEDQVLVFRNQLDSANDSANFYLYMAPTAGALDTIVSADGGADAVPLETFTSFSGMIAEGAEQASEDITMMTSTPTEVDVSRLSFVPVEGVPMAVEDDRRTGVVLEFEGMPSGYIAILFDEDSAENVAASLLPGAAEDAGAEMQQSAIQEIGNIITSGFLDGWANTLETTIEISPPTFVDDLGPAIIDPLVTDLAQSQEFAFLIDSTIRTEDDEFTCDIYALPNEHELRQALEQLAPA